MDLLKHHSPTQRRKMFAVGKETEGLTVKRTRKTHYVIQLRERV